MKKAVKKAVVFGSMDIEVMDSDGDIGSIVLMPGRIVEFNDIGRISLDNLKKVIEKADKFYDFIEKSS